MINPEINFENVADAATALSVLDGMSMAQQTEFAKSEYGQALLKAAKNVQDSDKMAE